MGCKKWSAGNERGLRCRRRSLEEEKVEDRGLVVKVKNICFFRQAKNIFVILCRCSQYHGTCFKFPRERYPLPPMMQIKSLFSMSQEFTKSLRKNCILLITPWRIVRTESPKCRSGGRVSCWCTTMPRMAGSAQSIAGRLMRWKFLKVSLLRQVGHFFWNRMEASMHFLQKMWPQIVDDASTSSLMQTGQVNFGSLGRSFTRAGRPCATFGCSV